MRVSMNREELPVLPQRPIFAHIYFRAPIQRRGFRGVSEWDAISPIVTKLEMRSMSRERWREKVDH